MSTLRIVNDDGEFQVVDLTKQKVSIRSNKQNEAYSKFVKEGKSKSFVFSEMNKVEEVASMLTTNQAGYLLMLITFIDFEGRIIKSNKESMTSIDIKKVLKLDKNDSTFYDFLNACLDAGLIFQDENNGAYYVNSQYHYKGKAGETPLVKVYSTTIRELYSKNKISDLGNLFLIQSRVHLTKNVLVKNPNQLDESKVEFLSREELGELLGISAKQVGVIIRRLSVDGMKVVASMKVGNVTRYVVNPEIFSRSVETKDDTLKFIFKTGGKQ